jgi:hypothetical protein
MSGLVEPAEFLHVYVDELAGMTSAIAVRRFERFKM